MSLVDVEVGSAALVGGAEVVIATLAQWHPVVDVYLDATADPAVLNSEWRVYAQNGAASTLVGLATVSSTGAGRRLIAGMPVPGATSIQLRAFSRNGSSAGPITAGIVGWDPQAQTTTTVDELVDNNPAGLPAGQRNVTRLSGLTWHPHVDVYVSAGPQAAGSQWFIAAALAGFSAAVIIASATCGASPSVVISADGGASSWELHASTPTGPTGSYSAALVGTSPASAAVPGGALPFVFDDSIAGANQNITNTRANAAAIDNTRVGIFNAATDTSGVLPGLRANHATGWGDQVTVRGDFGTAGGNGATCDSSSGLAVGQLCIAEGGTGAVALGENSRAIGEGTFAAGSFTTASGLGATAIGFGSAAGTQATPANNSLGMMGGAALGPDSCAIGPVATAVEGFALGEAPLSLALSAFAINEDTVTFAQRSLAAGFNSETAGERAMALGSVTRSEGIGACSLGMQGVATQDGELNLSGGTFLETEETHGGDAQTSWIVLRATTPGFDIQETGTFGGGVGGNQAWTPHIGRSYKIHCEVEISGYLMPSGTQVACAFEQEANVSFLSSGGPPVVTPNGAATRISGDPATASWTFGIATDGSGNISYTTGTARAATMAVCKVGVQSVQFPLQTPLQVANCVLWLEAQRGITLVNPASGQVQSWTDQSPSAMVFSLAGTPDGTGNPTYIANVANTEHAVRFDGITQALRSAGTLSELVNAVTGEYTMFIVAQPFGTNLNPDPTLRPCIFCDTGRVMAFAEQNPNPNGITQYVHTDAGGQVLLQINSISDEPTPNLYSVWYGTQAQENVTQYLRGQGDLLETENPIAATPLRSGAGRLVLGANFDFSQHCQVDVFEIVCFSRNLTRLERVQVTNYLNRKWGAAQLDPWTLPNSTIWYRADQGATYVGTTTAMTALTNLTSLGDPNANLGTPSPGSEPTWIQSDPAYGNQPTIQFSGAQVLWGGGELAVPIAQPCTVYLVGEIDDLANGVAVGGDIALGRNEISSIGADWSVYAGGAVESSSVASAAPNVIVAVFNGAGSELFVFTLTATNPAGPINPGANSLTLVTMGALYNAGALLSPMTGKIAEYGVRSGVDDPATMANIANYLKNRYQL